MQLDAKYGADMVIFIDRIICYSILEEVSIVVGDEALSALGGEINKELMLKVKRDGNAIADKTQLHFSSHNVTCFKYGVADSKKCQFNFSGPQIVQTGVTK